MAPHLLQVPRQGQSPNTEFLRAEGPLSLAGPLREQQHCYIPAGPYIPEAHLCRGPRGVHHSLPPPSPPCKEKPGCELVPPRDTLPSPRPSGRLCPWSPRAPTAPGTTCPGAAPHPTPSSIPGGGKGQSGEAADQLSPCSSPSVPHCPGAPRPCLPASALCSRLLTPLLSAPHLGAAFPGTPQTQHPSGSTSPPGPQASGHARWAQVTFPVLAHTGVLRAALWQRAGEVVDSILSPTFSTLYRQQATVTVTPSLPAEQPPCRKAHTLGPPNIHAEMLHSSPPPPGSPP